MVVIHVGILKWFSWIILIFPPNNVNYQPYAIFTAVWHERELAISYLSVKSKPDFLNQTCFIVCVHMKRNEITPKTWAIPLLHFSWSRGLKRLRGWVLKAVLWHLWIAKESPKERHFSEERSPLLPPWERAQEPMRVRLWSPFLCASSSSPISHICFPGILSFNAFFKQKVRFTWWKLIPYPHLTRQDCYKPCYKLSWGWICHPRGADKTLWSVCLCPTGLSGNERQVWKDELLSCSFSHPCCIVFLALTSDKRWRQKDSSTSFLGNLFSLEKWQLLLSSTPKAEIDFIDFLSIKGVRECQK